MLYWISLPAILWFSSCARVLHPVSRTLTEHRLRISHDRPSEQGWERTPLAYERMNRYGDVIERGEYGASVCRSTKTTDSGGRIRVSVDCFKDYSKLENLEFRFYDSSRRKVKEVRWQCEGNRKDHLERNVIYKYNDAGTMVSILATNADGNTILNLRRRPAVPAMLPDDWAEAWESIDAERPDSLHHTVVVTDKYGRPAEITEYFDGKFRECRRYQYGNYAERIMELSYTETPEKLHSIRERIYDADGKLIRSLYKAVAYADEERTVWKYNARGLLRSITVYDETDRLIRVSRWRYRYF